MVKVLIVDDSCFFRRVLSNLLEADPSIKVVGQASNGLEAIELFQQLEPDVITMDIEMPVMDGITALKKILAIKNIPILIFSGQSRQGADITLEALHAGAADFLTKNFNDVAAGRQELVLKLISKIKTLGLRAEKPARMAAQLKQSINHVSPVNHGKHPESDGHYQLIAIAASTGGPVALEKVLKELPSEFPSPILIIQHMPGTFTTAFAERLNQVCSIDVKEAVTGDVLAAGHVYVAPGGKQTYVRKQGRSLELKVIPSPPEINYKPCVDETFESIAESCVNSSVLAIIMTGMGSDGCEGARLLKQNNATIWAQDESTSVVYGMPMAVANEQLVDKIMPVHDIGINLAKSA